MKKESSWPVPLLRLTSFFDNYKALTIAAVLLFANFCAVAQYDSTKILQDQNSYGFRWKNGSFRSSLIIPNDTPKLALKDSGAVSFKGNRLWIYTGTYWLQASGTVIGTQSGVDSVTVAQNILCQWASGVPTCYQLNYYDSTTRFTNNGQIFRVDTMTFRNQFITYNILGVPHYIDTSTFTLAPAHATLDRIDVYVADDNNQLIYYQGTPGSLLYHRAGLNEIELIRFTVKAATTDPQGVSDRLVYNENTGMPAEWVGTTDIPSAVFNYATNPDEGSVSIHIPAVPTSGFIWHEGDDVANAELVYIKMRIRLTNAMGSGRIQLAFLKDGNSSTNNGLNILDGRFGLNGDLTGVYQDVVVPTDGFIFNPAYVNSDQLRLQFFNTPEMQIDKIRFQFGGEPSGSSDFVKTVNGQSGPNVTFKYIDSTGYNFDSTLELSFQKGVLIESKATSIKTLIGRTGIDYSLPTDADSAKKYIYSDVTVTSGPGGSGGISELGESATLNKTNDSTYEVKQTEFYGLIYEKSNFTSVTPDFDVSGATASISVNMIDISGGTSIGDVTKSIGYKDTTLLDNWVMEAKFQVGTKNATSYGVGIGIRGLGGIVNYPETFGIDLSSNASSGRLYQGTTMVAGLTAISFSTGDTMYLRLERVGAMFTMSAKNITTSSAPVSYNYYFQATGDPIPNTGKFSIFSYGSSEKLVSIKIFSNTPVSADYAFLGDSKLAGYGSNSYQSSVSAQTSNYAKVINLSGAGDKIDNIRARKPEIARLKPKTIILQIGRNDTYSSVAGDSILSLISFFHSIGSSVRVLQPFYETSSDQTPWYTWNLANIPDSNLIDTWAPTKMFGSAVTTDGVHPNQSGQDIIFNAIRTSGKINGLYSNRNYIGMDKSIKFSVGTVLNNHLLFTNGSNELMSSPSLTYDTTTKTLLMGKFVAYNFGNYANITLNGSNSSANTNFLSASSDMNLYISSPTSTSIIFRKNNASEMARFSTTNSLLVGQTTENSRLTVAGSVAFAYIAKTAAYTATISDYSITGDATSAAFQITLPTAVGIAGRIYTIKKIDASVNTVTVGTTSSQTIDGSTTNVLATQWKYVTVQSTGANWIIIGNN